MSLEAQVSCKTEEAGSEVREKTRGEAPRWTPRLPVWGPPPAAAIRHSDVPCLDAGLSFHEGLCANLRRAGRTTLHRSSSEPDGYVDLPNSDAGSKSASQLTTQ